jgi:hypothetical protein
MRLARLLAASLACVAAASQAALPDLRDMHQGELMLNACKGTEQRRLQRETAALAGSEAPAKASRLVQEMLCGTTPQSRAYVLAHTEKRVASTDEATGEVEPARPKMLPARLVEPVRMQAWSATVEQGDDGINVMFNADEGACVRRFTLGYRGGDWKIVAIGQACD